MSTDNWIQILLAVATLSGVLGLRILTRIEKTISNHELRITTLETNKRKTR